MHATALAAIGVHVELRLAFLPPQDSYGGRHAAQKSSGDCYGCRAQYWRGYLQTFCSGRSQSCGGGSRPCRGSRVANEINAAHPGKALAVVCDVSSADSVEKMVQRVTQEFGGVDILVNNAAWTDHKTIFDITEEEWDRTMNVCLRSVWYCARSAARAMIDQKKRGKIINIASTSGHWGRKEATAYTTAKAGVLNLTRSMAVQLASEGIRVNSI